MRYHFGKCDGLLAAPSEVDGVFDCAFVVIGVWCADADAAYLFHVVVLLHEFGDGGAQVFDKLLRVGGVVAAYGGLYKYGATGIDEPDFGGCGTDVDAYYIRFFHSVFIFLIG